MARNADKVGGGQKSENCVDVISGNPLSPSAEKLLLFKCGPGPFPGFKRESLNKKRADARHELCQFLWHARYTAVVPGLVFRRLSSLAIVDYRVIWSPLPPPLPAERVLLM